MADDTTKQKFKKFIERHVEEMKPDNERLDAEERHAEQVLAPMDPSLADRVKKKIGAEREVKRYIKQRTDKQNN